MCYNKSSKTKDNTMPLNNIPNDLSQYIAIIWVFILSIWGGTVHTIKKVRTGVIKQFTLREWIMDMVVSSFVGVVTYALCKYGGINEWLSVVMVSTAAHQGTRALLGIEQVVDKVIKRTGGVK